MAVVNKLYGQSVLNAFNGSLGNIAGSAVTMKVALLSSAYTPNQDTHTSWSDITGEVTGVGYTAGGVTLTNKTLTYDAATNTIKFDADDVQWNDSTITARYAVIYNATPANSADKKLLCYVDFGEEKVSADGAFKIIWNATNGIFRSVVG